MATATAPRVKVSRIADASPWVTAALSQPADRGDLVHELAEALENEIVAHPEVRMAEARIRAGLARFSALDEQLADELDVEDLVLVDFYCATVRATLTAVLARSEVAAT